MNKFLSPSQLLQKKKLYLQISDFDIRCPGGSLWKIEKSITFTIVAEIDHIFNSFPNVIWGNRADRSAANMATI